MQKARRQWGMVGKVASKKEEMVQVRGKFYKEIVQSVLLCGIESWAVIGATIKVLEGFHHQASRQIVGMTAQHTTCG